MKLQYFFSPMLYKRAYDKLNKFILSRVFDDYARIRAIPQHLDVLNLGSNPGKYGMDYSGCGIKGYNIAVGPQTLEYDFRMLKNYHSFLDENGSRLLLLLFCPFSLCKFRYSELDGDVSKDLRYYFILHHAMINNYNERVYQRWKNQPIIQLLKSPKLLKNILLPNRLKRINLRYNPLTPEQMELSGKQYIQTWKKEFSLSDFNIDNLPSNVKTDLNKNSIILDNIISFCDERSIKPVIVLPPVSGYVMRYIPDKFREFCMYSIIREKNILVLDYTENKELCVSSNFVDALCLNKVGRKKFTAKVMLELQNLGLLQK